MHFIDPQVKKGDTTYDYISVVSNIYLLINQSAELNGEFVVP